jgi:hypothetical protein
VTLNDEQATSFGNVADSYDKVRPRPPADALDWLVPAGCHVAVDLAAGTGLFTRALLGRAAEVIAVEPDGRMREVLAKHSPGVRVLEGRGESAGAEFTNVEAASFWFTRTITVDDTVRWLATNSSFITASAADQAAGLDRCRAALLARADGDQVIQMPMRSWCWRADRTSRP